MKNRCMRVILGIIYLRRHRIIQFTRRKKHEESSTRKIIKLLADGSYDKRQRVIRQTVFSDVISSRI